MESELTIGWDGNYAICFKTLEKPVLEEMTSEFSPLGLKVRVDENNHWVFLRSPDKDVILNCYETFKHRYNLKAVKNSRQPEPKYKPDNEIFVNKRNDSNRYESKYNKDNTFNGPGNTYKNGNNYRNHKQNITEMKPRIDEKNLVTVWETVIYNLPPDFIVSEIIKLCQMAGVEPYSANKHVTQGMGVPYCSVYVTSSEQVKHLTDRLQEAWYDDYGLTVVDANDLYD